MIGFRIPSFVFSLGRANPTEILLFRLFLIMRVHTARSLFRLLLLLSFFPVAKGALSVESRLFRLDRRPAGVTAASKINILTLEGAKPVGWVYSFTAGGAYTDGDDGSRTWSTPFSLDAQNGDFGLTLLEDGYMRISGATKASGLGDPTFGASYVFGKDNPESPTKWFKTGLSVTLPAGGDVGSAHSSEALSGSYTFTPAAGWSIKTGVNLSRAEGAISGANPYGQSALIRIEYGWGPDDRSSAVSLQAKQSHHNGGSNTAELLFEWDFPFWKKTNAALSLAQGLTKGARDTSIEFDVTW